MNPFWRIRHPAFPRPLCRLGLATRGGSGLEAGDIYKAIEAGVDFLNWCGQPDGLSRAIASLGARRRELAVCVQFEARTAAEAEKELPAILNELHTDYLDVLTFYYVEAIEEWRQITAPDGALGYCRKAREAGQVRLLGLTSHQRPLAAAIAKTGAIDLLMIRYNAAHRGAEQDIFPITGPRNLPVVAFTCLRWGALLRSTPEDPPGFQPPPAPSWYRFDLHSPFVTVALMAPQDRRELDENLHLLKEGPLAPEEYDRLASHGRRVRRHAGSFP